MLNSHTFRRVGIVIAAGVIVTGLSATSATAASVTPNPQLVTAAASIPYNNCISGGSTAADAALAARLSSKLNGTLEGNLNGYEISCARQVVIETKLKHLTVRAAQIAITTTIVESTIHDYTEAVDHTSLGLFQQQDSWGTASQREDPRYATSSFLNRMVADYPNGSWKTAAIGDVCQTVQVSAYPDRYAAQAHDGGIIAHALWGVVGGDYDADGSSDLAVWRPSTGEWWDHGYGATLTWGLPGDKPVPGDYNGDGVADNAVWRPSTGTWYVHGQTTVQYGQAGDIPVPGDYDGNGTTDLAVFRPSTGTWYIRGIGTYQYGQAGDIPVPADYDGNGTTDIAVFRPGSGVGTGTWYIKGQGDTVYGNKGDIPVPADYHATGVANLAVWRPSTGQWWVLDGTAGGVTYGQAGDIPQPGDYNGDGAADLAVYRPGSGAGTGTWYVKGQGDTVYGNNTDIPTVYQVHNTTGTS